MFTVPQNEKSVERHLGIRRIESFLPTYEKLRIWKNRQRTKTLLPLFPCYLFVRIAARERIKVLQCPGVLNVIGNARGPIPLWKPSMNVQLREIKGSWDLGYAGFELSRQATG